MNDREGDSDEPGIRLLSGVVQVVSCRAQTKRRFRRAIALEDGADCLVAGNLVP